MTIKMNRNRMLPAYGRLEIPRVVRKPLMILLNLPNTVALDLFASVSRRDDRVPTFTSLRGAFGDFHWPEGQFRSRGSDCPEGNRRTTLGQEKKLAGRKHNEQVRLGRKARKSQIYHQL